MTRADFPQNIIDETLDQLGLKDGGIARLGFDNGGDVEYDNIDTIEAYAKRLADEEDISYKEALERAKKEMPGKKSFFEKFGEAMDVFRPGAGLTGYANGGDVEHHNTFLTYYRAQRWDDALKIIELNKITYPELSEYYEMMRDRINHLKEDQPGEDWDTIFRATSK